jgi:hypothetical protein
MMEQLLLFLGSGIVGILIFRTLVKGNADSGQRELEIKSAVIIEKINNLEDKSKELDKKTSEELQKLEAEQGKVLNAEELADWFNSRNKPKS